MQYLIFFKNDLDINKEFIFVLPNFCQSDFRVEKSFSPQWHHLGPWRPGVLVLIIPRLLTLKF